MIIVQPNFWGAFKIPAFAFAIIALLLILRDTNSNIEYPYIQLTTKYAIGASIISYCHSLMHSTWENHNKGPDLPFKFQILFMVFHVFWFGEVFLLA
jgi:hypothetical protein